MTNRAYNYVLLLFIAAALIGLCHIASAQEITAEGGISRPVVEYKSGSLRDPFQAPTEKKETKAAQEVQEKQERKTTILIQPGSDMGNLKVQGIIWGGKMPQAIINDQVFSVGDSIEGSEILDIDKNGITLSSGGILNQAIPGGSTDSSGKNISGETSLAPAPAALTQRP